MEERSLSVGLARADQLHREKPRDWKTVLGIFYTPTPLAEALVEWAVTDPGQTILEPSFGGCGILNVIAARLISLGATQPWKNMYGCDKDPRAFRFLPEKYQNPGKNRHFLSGDFLRKKSADFSARGFDIVLGNPPYVSRRNLPGAQAAAARVAIAGLDIKLSPRASLWAYFILHGLSFLRVGGKIGWILPRSLSQSLYGKQLLAYLTQRFTTVGVIALGQRMFMSAGTDELTDVLVCEGYQESVAQNTSAIFYYADSIPHLKIILSSLGEPPDATPTDDVNSLPPRAATLTSEQRTAFHSFRTALPAKKVGDLLDIQIGLVTGAADFFIRRKSELRAYGLTRSDVQIILAKFRHAPGIESRCEDCEILFQKDESVLLVNSSRARLSVAVTKYLKRFPLATRKKVKTFAKRTPWHRVDDGKIADAFLPCLIRQGPRMVLNSARITCTNNVLRVWFKDGLQQSAAQKIVALSLLSTFGQVSAELFGRACGSGGLKLEPSDWDNVWILMPEHVVDGIVTTAFSAADKSVRASDYSRAREIADEFLAATIPGFTQMNTELRQLVLALGTLREGR